MIDINDLEIGTVVFRLWFESDTSYEAEIQEATVIRKSSNDHTQYAVLEDGYYVGPDSWCIYATKEEALAEQLKQVELGVKYYQKLARKLRKRKL
jgi:hypothetical protein